MDSPSEDPQVVVVGTAAVKTLADGGAELGLHPETFWMQKSEVELALRELARGQRVAARLVRRARIVVGVVFEGLTQAAVAKEVGTTRDTVRLWVGRFLEWPDVEALEDRERTGHPCRIAARDQAVVLSLACQKPQDLGRCEGRMTQLILVEEAAKRGSVMSRSSVHRILATAEVQPHRERYYLFTRKDEPEYVARRDAICDLYMRTLPLDEVIVCFDEKTGVQVLGLPERTPHGGRRPPGFGQTALIEQHYRRHGSRTLVGAVRPDTGRLVAAKVYASGTYKTQQTIEFLLMVRRALPEARIIHLVMDNGSTHCSAAMRAFLASEEGKVFQVAYTPVHASWLNLAENFLSRFSRRYLHSKRWTGLEAFDADMLVCFDAYQWVAKPMRWRYNPRERAASRARRPRVPPCSPQPTVSPAASCTI